MVTTFPNENSRSPVIITSNPFLYFPRPLGYPSFMDESNLLAGVLTKTGDLIAGVQDDQWGLPTPCAEYDVRALVDHVVGWVQVFDAGCHGKAVEGDPLAFRSGPDPAAEFRAAAVSLAAGWKEFGLDRSVRIMSGEMPGESVFNMTVMEYLTHGWDIAVATGQPIPFSEDEAIDTLARAERTLPPEYRGDGGAFGEIVVVGPDAPAVSRLAAFLGRQP
jgi:uncharacterized protein (TIGR03086 family)